MTMKLGLAIGYSGAHLGVPVALVQGAEELGYDSVWSAEAYGSDAITPLAFLAARTSRIKLGTGAGSSVVGKYRSTATNISTLMASISLSLRKLTAPGRPAALLNHRAGGNRDFYDC
jgi:hypothetical protein